MFPPVLVWNCGESSFWTMKIWMNLDCVRIGAEDFIVCVYSGPGMEVDLDQTFDSLGKVDESKYQVFFYS